MAIAFWSGMVWDQIEICYGAPIETAIKDNAASQVVVLTLANFPANGDDEVKLPAIKPPEACIPTALAALSPLDTHAEQDPTPASVAPKSLQQILNIVAAGTTQDKIDLESYSRGNIWPKITDLYRSVLKRVTVLALPQIEEYAALTDSIYFGVASTYNPNRDGIDADFAQTASGELYDPFAWTAAIQIDLREQFGGVRFGKLYRPAFALIESGDRRAIVKINDVGPLRPGRVIDLNERSMRYFDPTLERGLVPDMRITFLPGQDWTPGPVADIELASNTSVAGSLCVTCLSKSNEDRDSPEGKITIRYGSSFLSTASN